MSKEDLGLIEPYPGGREWVSLLNSEDSKILTKMEKQIFGAYLRDGYEIVWAMGVDSGRLLKEGQFVGEVQAGTARDQIGELKHRDLVLLSDETLRRNEKSDYKWQWWDARFRKNHLPEYIWTEGAVLPPSNWQKLNKLSATDLKFDKLGITIFVKRDAEAKRSKIFK